jgi:MFS family permease
VADGISSFAKLAGGWLAARPSLRKPIAVTGYLLTGLSTSAFGFVTAWPQIVLARAVGWMGRGARGPSRDVLLANAVRHSQIGRAFGFERAMDTVGAILGPVCAIVFLKWIGIQSALIWTIVPGAAAALNFAALVPSAGKSSPEQLPRFWESVRNLPPEFRKFLIAVAFFGLGDFAHSMLILRVVQLLSPGHGAARAGAIGVALYTAHNIVYAGASYPIGAFTDRVDARWRGRRILAGGYLLAAMTSTGFLLLPQSNPPVISLAGLLCLAGLYVAAQDTLEKAVAADLLPSETRAMGYGVLATVNGIGDFVSSIAVGFLWSKVSPASGFAYAAVLTAAGGVVLLAVSRRKRPARA